LVSDRAFGEGASFTIGAGNETVTSLADQLVRILMDTESRDIEELMSDFGAVQKRLSDHAQLRWLGPQKGAVHLALSSVTNALFDLWARTRAVPLWKLLLSLSDLEVVNLLDLSWVEDSLSRADALRVIHGERPLRPARRDILNSGYPGYDTSVGWFGYPDDQLAENARRAVAEGFSAMKLKVGSPDLETDVRRVKLVRDAAGADTLIMVDANQQWQWPAAVDACEAMADLGVYWVEEPTHPDDVMGHQRLVRRLRPKSVSLAAGEHIPNRVVFKNFMQADAIDIVQVDAMRVAGVSEFLTVSFLARQFGLSVVPHVGDMGQLHQHLVLFNHIALGLPAEFLEYIPHLSREFVNPAIVEDGVYRTPDAPGAGMALRILNS
jgi:L-fuconate dehydratase